MALAAAGADGQREALFILLHFCDGRKEADDKEADDEEADDELERALRGLQEDASRAHVASVLACTCRAARTCADDLTRPGHEALPAAARREALWERARAMRAVETAVYSTPLQEYNEALSALKDLCDTAYFARCDAEAWRVYEEELLDAVALGNENVRRRAVAWLQASCAPPDSTVSWAVTCDGGMAASVAGHGDACAYADAISLLKQGPDEPQAEVQGGALDVTAVAAPLRPLRHVILALFPVFLAIFAYFFARWLK